MQQLAWLMLTDIISSCRRRHAGGGAAGAMPVNPMALMLILVAVALPGPVACAADSHAPAPAAVDDQPARAPSNCSWATQPDVGCAKRGGAGNGGWQIPAAAAAACCQACTMNRSGGSHPKCEAWTFLPYSYHPNGVCLMSSVPDCQPVDSPTGAGAVGACNPANTQCKPPAVPDPLVCQPVKRPAAPVPAPPPPGIKVPPHIVTILVDDLGFDDLRSH